MSRRILFYTSNVRNFRSTLLGYLLELQSCEGIEITLATESLDPSVEKLIRDRHIFPSIKEVVHIGQYDKSEYSIWAENRRLARLAHDLVERVMPDIVFASSDFHSIFELYLCKRSRRSKARIITVSCSISGGPMDEVSHWVDLYLFATRYRRLPVIIARALNWCRKVASHVTVYWVLPLLNGRTPFSGRSSYVLYRGQSGERYSDYHVVFSAKEKRLFAQSGVPAEKVVVIAHPNSRGYIATALVEESQTADYCIDYVVLLAAEGIGFNRVSNEEISESDRSAINVKVIREIIAIDSDARIVIKPHPDISATKLSLAKDAYEILSDRVSVVSPSDPVEIYTGRGRVILGLPRAASTALLLASLHKGNKIIVAFDYFEELLGDYYKDSETVKYVTTFDDLRAILTDTGRERSYDRGWQRAHRSGTGSEFQGLADLIHVASGGS